MAWTCLCFSISTPSRLAFLDAKTYFLFSSKKRMKKFLCIYLIFIANLLFLGLAQATADPLIEKEQVKRSDLVLKGLRFNEQGEFFWAFAGGNEDWSSWAVKHSGSLKYFRHTLENKFEYKAYSDHGVRSLQTVDLLAKYIYSLQKNLGFLYGYNIVFNQFAETRKTQNHDVGPRLFFSLSDSAYFLSEFTYRYTLEQDKKGEKTYSNKARVFAQIGFFLDSTKEVNFWLEYVQRLNRPRDFIVSFEPSIYFYFGGPNYVRLSTLGYLHQPITYQGEKPFTYYGETSIGTKF